MNGLLNINKPGGMTSHDVVNAIRRLIQTRRVGHTGTLDPLATGVLVVLIGYATRLARFLSGADKTYHAVIRLGETTTTYDAEGELIKCQSVSLTRPEIETALSNFRGNILQVPPMHSAIKVNGKPLYKLAHRGQEIEREPRPVTIHALTIGEWNPPELTLEITCSAGTYIRSLANDLGEILGCGGHLKALNRTASGQFTIAESYTLEELTTLADMGRLEEAILPPQHALTIPKAHLTSEQVQAVQYGQSILLEGQQLPRGNEIQAYTPKGQLIAILIPIDGERWRPNIVFPQT